MQIPSLDAIGTLFFSILIGVFGNAATYLIAFFLTKTVFPKYTDHVYKGMRVNGNWVIIQDIAPTDGEPLSSKWLLSATLEQKANELSGSAQATRNHTGESTDVLSYKLTGYIYDRLVNISIRTTDQAKIAYSNFLLEVSGDGSEMIGYRSFYGLKKGKIRSIQCTWNRQR